MNDEPIPDISGGKSRLLMTAELDWAINRDDAVDLTSPNEPAQSAPTDNFQLFEEL